MIKTAHQSVTMRQNTSIQSNKCEIASVLKQRFLASITVFTASLTFGRAPNILSSTTKGNHFQKYKKVFTKNPFLCENSLQHQKECFRSKQRNYPYFEQTTMKYIHMQSHILRKNNRLKSHQFQVHVSHKNTICADISSLIKINIELYFVFIVSLPFIMESIHCAYLLTIIRVNWWNTG